MGYLWLKKIKTKVLKQATTMSDGPVFINTTHARFVNEKFADVHDGFRPPHITFSSKLHGGDRAHRMIASGGRSSQPLVIRHMLPDGTIPFAPEINVDYYATGVSKQSRFVVRDAESHPPPPELPDFTTKDVNDADSDKLKKYLAQIHTELPDLPFYDQVMAENGDQFKTDARKLAMHWAVLYHQDPLTAKDEMNLWMQTVFDPEPSSALSYMDYWTNKVQQDIASGASTNTFLSYLRNGNYMSDAQKAIDGIFDFSSIYDNWVALKLNNTQAANEIATKVLLTGNGGGYQALPNQVVAPSFESVAASKGDGYADSSTAFSEALGAALTDIRYQYLNSSASGGGSDLLLLVGGVTAAGLITWWLLK